MAHGDEERRVVEFQLLTVQEVAEILRVTTDHVYELIRQARLPGAIRVGRFIRINAEALQRWIELGGEVH